MAPTPHRPTPSPTGKPDSSVALMPKMSCEGSAPTVPFASNFRGSSPSSPLSTPQAGSDISAPTGQDSERETGQVFTHLFIPSADIDRQLLCGGNWSKALAHLELSLVLDLYMGNDNTMGKCCGTPEQAICQGRGFLGGGAN